jgi:hypothetical protein
VQRTDLDLDVLPEIWQDFIRDDVVRLGQGVTWDSHSWPSSLKAYVQSDAGVEIVLRTLSGYPTYFLVFAKRADLKTEHSCKVGITVAGGAGHNGPAQDAHRRVVLVSVPHTVENAEPIVFHIGPSVIRLMAFQGVDLLRWHQTFKDGFRECVEGRPVLTQWEDQIFVALQTSRGNGPDQVVQQGAEVVDKVSSDESKDRRYRLMAGNLEDIAAVLEITSTFRGPRLATCELLDLNVEVVEVKFRSFEPPFKVEEADGGHAGMHTICQPCILSNVSNNPSG